MNKKRWLFSLLGMVVVCGGIIGALSFFGHFQKAHATGGCPRGSALAIYRYRDNKVVGSPQRINGKIIYGPVYRTQIHKLSTDSNQQDATCEGVLGYDASVSSLPYTKTTLYGLTYTFHDAKGFASKRYFVYTIDPTERQKLLNGGWKETGIDGTYSTVSHPVRVYSPQVGSQVPHAVAIHRLYNNSNGDHLYSTSSQEVRNLLNAPNTPWNDERVPFYMLSVPDPAPPAH